MISSTMILDHVDVIKLDVSIWSARKKLRPEDLKLGDGSSLPPDELATLGTMRIVDRQHIRTFDTLKKRAETLCLKRGARFLGGYAIPVSVMASIIPELDVIQAEFNQQKIEFLGSYQEHVQSWVDRYPQFEEAIKRHVDSVDDIGSRLNFDYCVFRVSKPDSDVNDTLDRSVGGIGEAVFKDIAQDASGLLDNSFVGKSAVTRKAINPLVRMRDKLQGLAFTDTRIQAVVDSIDLVLGSIPKRGEITGGLFNSIMTLVMLLADTDRMKRHGQGLADSQQKDQMPDLAVYIPAAVVIESEDAVGEDEIDPKKSSPVQAALAFDSTTEIATSVAHETEADLSEFDDLLDDQPEASQAEPSDEQAARFVENMAAAMVVPAKPEHEATDTTAKEKPSKVVIEEFFF